MPFKVNADPRSEWILPGVPSIKMISFRHLIAEMVDLSLQGMAYGNLLNSSTTVRTNPLPEYFDLGNGPSKSTDNRSRG